MTCPSAFPGDWKGILSPRQWGVVGSFNAQCRCCTLKILHFSPGWVFFPQQKLRQWIVGTDRGEGKRDRPLSFCLFPLPSSCPHSSTFSSPPSLPSLLLSPAPDVPGLVHLSVLSWEEVPSHLTLRKWFQCMLVWILAVFCNCQFPYQSVCISIGRTWATSPLLLSSFVLIECCCCFWWWRLLTRAAGHCSWLCLHVWEKQVLVLETECGFGEFVGYIVSHQKNMYLVEMSGCHVGTWSFRREKRKTTFICCNPSPQVFLLTSLKYHPRSILFSQQAREREKRHE